MKQGKTVAEKIAELRHNIEARQAIVDHDRAELAALEAEERARRPALAAGQVWRDVERGDYYISHLPHDSALVADCRLVCVGDGVAWSTKPWFEGDDFGDASRFEYVGLARDVLRVVDWKTAEAGATLVGVAPQVAPEPTGAELVGRRCWVRISDNYEWSGPTEILEFDKSDDTYRARERFEDSIWFYHAKLYVEGVAP